MNTDYVVSNCWMVGVLYGTVFNKLPLARAKFGVMIRVTFEGFNNNLFITVLLFASHYTK